MGQAIRDPQIAFRIQTAFKYWSAVRLQVSASKFPKVTIFGIKASRVRAWTVNLTTWQCRVFVFGATFHVCYSVWRVRAVDLQKHTIGGTLHVLYNRSKYYTRNRWDFTRWTSAQIYFHQEENIPLSAFDKITDTPRTHDLNTQANPKINRSPKHKSLSKTKPPSHVDRPRTCLFKHHPVPIVPSDLSQKQITKPQQASATFWKYGASCCIIGLRGGVKCRKSFHARYVYCMYCACSDPSCGPFLFFRLSRWCCIRNLEIFFLIIKIVLFLPWVSKFGCWSCV